MPTATKAPRLRGPVLVSLGSAGWGAENLFRSRLDGLGLAAYPIVLVEHLLQVVFTLPWLLANRAHLRAVPRGAFFYVFLSGAIGSCLGTVCYTAALGAGVNPTAAAMLLNLQPVVSTVAGALLFKEAITRRFFLWASVAIFAGLLIALPGLSDLTHREAWSGGASAGLLLIGGTIFCWGFATAAGRGAMRAMPVGLGAPLRLWAGLFTAAIVVAVRAATGHGVGLGAFGSAAAIENMLLLSSLTGALPLFVYFAGLAHTPASLGGYCEMFYTISATAIGWLLLGGDLLPHQLAAAVLLVVAIVMLNRSSHSEGAASDEKPAQAA